MIKAVAAWSGLALVWVFIAAGIWAIYDDCFSEDDYNVICRRSTMAIDQTWTEAIQPYVKAKAAARAAVKRLLFGRQDTTGAP